MSDKHAIEHKSKAKLRSVYDNHEIYKRRDRKIAIDATID